MVYVATFFAHFGAVRFNKACENAGLYSRMQPVPRFLSSSCGTCVKYESDTMWPKGVRVDEVESVALFDKDKFTVIYKAENV